MAHIIGNIAVMPRMAKRTQNLSCMGEIKKQFCRKAIYDSEAVQQRINDAAKERTRLDYEIKKKYENIKHINFLG